MGESITMAKAGIDVVTYKPHSIRAAATSKAVKVGGNLEQILKIAGWNNATTFARFYKKEVKSQKSLSESVLTPSRD